MTSDRKLHSHVAHVATCVLLLALLFAVSPPSLAQADDADSTQRLRQLRDDLADARSQLDSIVASESDLEAAAVAARNDVLEADRALAAAYDTEARATQELEDAEQDLDAAEADLADAQAELEVAEDELAETEAEVARLRELLRRRARTAYMEGGSLGLIEVLLKIEDYGDIVQAQQLATTVIRQDDQLVSQWLDLQRRHSQARAEAERTRRAHADARERAAAARGEAASRAEAAELATEGAELEQARRDQVLDRARAALANLDDDRLQVEERIDGLEAAIEAEEAAIQRAVAEAERQRREELAAAATPTPSQPAGGGDTQTTAPDPGPEPEPSPDPGPAPDPEPEPPPSPPGDGEGVCASNSAWVWPTVGCITSGYGPRAAPIPGASTFHRGIDIPGSSGQALRAVAGGTVWRASYSSSHGYVTVLDHGGGLYTLYAHQRRLPPVSVGQWVPAGAVVGEMGTTGISTGNHLHFEVHVGCAYSCSRPNPMPYFGS